VKRARLVSSESTNRMGEITLNYLKHKLIQLSLLMGGVHPTTGPWDNDYFGIKKSERPDISFLC
jgi:hypothetical protein